MDTEQKMENRLWEYIDGRCTNDDINIIELLLENDRKWKEKYNELLEIHRLMQSSELDEPSMRFTKNVMEQIAKYHIAPATKSYINKRIIWGIAAFFILLFTSFLIYSFGQLDWSTKSENSFSIDFTKFDYSKIFSNTYVNVFMMINVVLGLFFLDNYFSQKRKKLREKAW